MQKLLRLLFVTAMLSASAYAAADNDILSKAANEFEMGHFMHVDSLLGDNVSQKWSDDQRIKAYRLLTLSSLYLENETKAKSYAARLLEVDPFYSAYEESPRFQDLLNSLKNTAIKIKTASNQEESLEESPVPMTVITREMIDYSGAQTLQDLLCLYVPGMSKIGGMESNIGMRSVYGNMQEDILFMLDGHRLNSGASNSESPDFRNSLNKIDHIEVLRGPASSLYGNVALTAVVNVITKTGSKVNGLQLNGLAGMHYQFGGGFLFGGGNRQADILAWGNVYNSRGEIYKSEYLNERYIGGYNKKPAFDFGVKAHWRDFTVSVSAQHAKLVPFINLLSCGTEYTYDNYLGDNGNRPGTSRTTINASVDYVHKWKKFTLDGTVYFNTERTEIYNVLGDTVNAIIASALPEYFIGITMKNPATRGVWQTLSWENYAFGTNVNGNSEYSLGNGTNHGSVMAGVQFDYFMMTSSKFQLGGKYDRILASNNQGMSISDEWSVSPYLQLKHYFGKHFIFNGGLRYDHKERFNGTAANAVSPRATFIWLPSDDRLSVKFGYARSFVDAPYIYRANALKILSGKELRPQFLNSLQLGALYKMKPWKTTFEVNVFYNLARDLVRFNINSLKSILSGQGDIFNNSGVLDVAGVELVAEYNQEGRLFGNFNMTVQHPTRMEAINVYDGGNVNNISLMIMNATCAGRVWGNKRIGSFWLRGNVHFQTANDLVIVNIDNMFTNVLAQAGSTFQNSNSLGEVLSTLHQKANAELNIGVDWKWKSRLKLSLDVYNVTGSRYAVGTMMTNPTPTQGTRVVGKVQINL